MKKTLFTLMISTFALVSIQTAFAVPNEDENNNNSIKISKLKCMYISTLAKDHKHQNSAKYARNDKLKDMNSNGNAQKKQPNLPKPDLSTCDKCEISSPPKWIPLAPIDPKKDPVRYAQWSKIVHKNPGKYYMNGNTFFVYK